MKLDTFTQAYIETALWSSTDNADETGGAPLDANYGIADLAPATLESMKADCADFQESFGEFIADDLARAGHDFWLTRHHHGANFLDGDWSDEAEKHLTKASQAYKETELYVGDDGMIYS